MYTHIQVEHMYMHISIYYISIYMCEIWRTFLLYKVLIGWLECLRIIVREEFQGFEFNFPPETNRHRTLPPRGFGTKDCMIFLLKKIRKKWKLLREKRCLKVPLIFIDTYCNQKSSSAAYEVSGGLSVQATAAWDSWPLHQSHDPLPADHMHGNPLLLLCTATLFGLCVVFEVLLFFMGH